MPDEPLTPDEMADLLGETETEPRRQLARIAHWLGPVATAALLDAVMVIEAQGGMLLADGRRRTSGGVLFAICRAGLPPWQAPPCEPLAEVLSLSEALGSLPDNLVKGEATVKLVLVGRPKETVDRGEYVALQMESRAPQSYPKGLPTPPNKPTVWSVLIARKQWLTVASQLRQDKEDKLIVEGQPCQDSGLMTLYATQVVTQSQQRARKDTQRATNGTGAAKAAV